MPGQCPGECGRRIAGRDACPTQKGRHPPKRGTPALPLPACLLHFSVCIVPVRTAGRRGLSLSRFCPSPFNPPFWAALARGTCRIFGSQIWIDSELEICREAGRTCPASWCPRLCCPSDSRGETTLCHICPQRPQHRVSLPGRYTECHPTCRRGTQALAGASTGLRGLEVSPPPQISRHWQRGIRQKICCRISGFPEVFVILRFGCKRFSMITA